MTLAELLMLMLQAACFGGACRDGLWWKALYWFGALLLTAAVVKGLKS